MPTYFFKESLTPRYFLSLRVTLLLLIFSSLKSEAQYINIQIGIGDDEPSIIMNPNKPKYLIAATNKATIYSSEDTGKIWKEKLIPYPNVFSGDPCLVVDTSNVFYHFSLGGNYQDTSWLEVLNCYRSYDNGFTWFDSTQIGRNGLKDQDKEWAIVNRKNNHIYLTWTEFDQYGSSDKTDSSRILFSKSIDQAKSWSNPIQLNQLSGDCIDDDRTTKGAVPAIGPNGEIYVSWADYDGIKFDRSFDEGNSWLDKDVFVSSQPRGWNFSVPGIYRCNGLPITECDRSNSPYKGRIYVNWSDQSNGFTNTDIWISYSDDSGSTWSNRIRVNDDTTKKHQFMSWMTIDQSNGYIYIVFYDRRNYTDLKTDVYLAKSTDGGLTFVNEKISSSYFIPSSSVFFGDYTNITAHQNIVRPIWTRADGNQKSVWTALVQYEPEHIENSPEFVIYPNPAHDILNLSYQTSEDLNIDFNVYDAQGRICKKVKLPGGNQTQKIPIHDLASGMYIYEIKIQHYIVKTAKFVK